MCLWWYDPRYIFITGISLRTSLNLISPTKDLEMVCFTEWLLRVLKENSRTGAMCTVALVETWLCFLTFHWTCVALFHQGSALCSQDCPWCLCQGDQQVRVKERVRQDEQTADRDVRDDSRTNPVMPRKSPQTLTQTPPSSEISPGMVSSFPQEAHSSVTFRLSGVWVGYLSGGIPTLLELALK